MRIREEDKAPASNGESSGNGVIMDEQAKVKKLSTGF